MCVSIRSYIYNRPNNNNNHNNHSVSVVMQRFNCLAAVHDSFFCVEDQPY